MDIQSRFEAQGEAAKAVETMAGGLGALALEGVAVKLGIVDPHHNLDYSIAASTTLVSTGFVIAGAMRLGNHLFGRLHHERP